MQVLLLCWTTTNRRRTSVIAPIPAAILVPSAATQTQSKWTHWPIYPLNVTTSPVHPSEKQQFLYWLNRLLFKFHFFVLVQLHLRAVRVGWNHLLLVRTQNYEERMLLAGRKFNFCSFLVSSWEAVGQKKGRRSSSVIRHTIVLLCERSKKINRLMTWFLMRRRADGPIQCRRSRLTIC